MIAPHAADTHAKGNEMIRVEILAAANGDNGVWIAIAVIAVVLAVAFSVIDRIRK